MRGVSWTAVVPVVAVVGLAATWGSKPPALVLVIVGVLLAGSVTSAVHHAEVVAHRVGEPFGSLVLAVAVTVIEVGLIVTLMVSGGSETETLARDTVFAAVMITCNGIVGASLLVGAVRRRLAVFNAEGTATALATVATLATLTLVLPRFTTSEPGPEFSGEQSRSRRSRRWRCTASSWSCRPCGIATTSCRSTPATRTTSTLRRPPTGRRSPRSPC